MSARSPGPGAPAQEVWVAIATAPDAAVAERIGRLAVERRHAACANLIGGLRSVYRWRGAIEEASEVLILFKTTAAEYPALASLVAAEHPYEVPELLAFPAADGLAAYLGWVRAEVGGVDSPRAKA